MRRSSLSELELAVNREIQSEYDDIRAVATHISSVIAVATEDLPALTTALEEALYAKDFTGISIVAGATAGYDAGTKTLTIPVVNGTDGTDGQVGDSAYDVAVADGFNGTGAEWLDSLRGQDGYNGSPGPQGDKGDVGPQGDIGETGITGVSIVGVELQSTSHSGGRPAQEGELDTYAIIASDPGGGDPDILNTFDIRNGTDGDMVKLTYDTNDDGVVNDSDMLGGKTLATVESERTAEITAYTEVYTTAEKTSVDISTTLDTESATLPAAINELHMISADTAEPTGILDVTETTLAFDDVSRTLSLTPTGTDFSLYIRGHKQTISTVKSVEISDATGAHYIYIDPNGDMQETTVFNFAALFHDNAYIAAVYWSAADQEAAYFADERHGCIMDWATHSHFHLSLGTQFIEGFDLSNMTVDGDGDTAAAAQFTVTDGIIRDEDLIHVIADGSPQTLSPIANIPLLYRDGVDGHFRKLAATDYPVATTGGRAVYNEFTGGTWQLTEVPDRDFVLTHIYATNDINNPIFGIIGTAAYTDNRAARSGANIEIATVGELPFEELLAVATVIYETQNAFSNAVKSRVISTDSGANYIDWREESINKAIPVSGHNVLAGRDEADAHPASAVTFTPTGKITATDVQTLGTQLDVLILKDKDDAIIAPTIDNDITEGYAVNSKWADVTADKAYICIDAIDGAAVWLELGGGGGGSRPNIVINGDMTISERMDISSPVTMANSTYYLDGWRNTMTGSGANATIQRIDTGLPEVNMQYAMRIKSVAGFTGNVGAFSYVENSSLYAGKPVTISVWVRTNITGVALILSDGVSQVINSGHTGDGTWQKLGGTATIADTPGQIQFYVRPPTIFISNTGYLEITQACLLEGEEGVTCDVRSYGEELNMCQRVGELFNDDVANASIGSGSAYSITQARIEIPMVTKRDVTDLSLLVVNPTNFVLYDGVTSIAASTITLSSDSTEKLAVLTVTVASGLTQYRPYTLRGDGSANNSSLFIECRIE